MVAVRHVCDSGEETRSETEIPHITSLHTFESDDYLVLCADQFETSTSPTGIPGAFDCASCPGRGEFERCVGGVGNLNQIFLLI